MNVHSQDFDAPASETATATKLGQQDLSRVVGDAPLADRCRLAEDLALSATADQATVSRLADDDIAVAAPLLRHSPLLESSFQLRVVRVGDIDRCRLLTKRSQLDSVVVTALIEMESAIIAMSLLSNSTIHFTADQMDSLIAQSENDRSLQSALILRPELTAKDAKRIKEWASDPIGQIIEERFGRNVQSSKQVPRSKQTADPHDRVHPRDMNASQAQRYVADLKQTEQLRPVLLTRALHYKNDDLLNVAFAGLLDISVAKAKKFFESYSATRLATACRALALTEAEFRSMYHLARLNAKLETPVSVAENQEISGIFERPRQEALVAVRSFEA